MLTPSAVNTVLHDSFLPSRNGNHEPPPDANGPTVSRVSRRMCGREEIKLFSNPHDPSIKLDFPESLTATALINFSLNNLYSFSNYRRQVARVPPSCTRTVFIYWRTSKAYCVWHFRYQTSTGVVTWFHILLRIGTEVSGGSAASFFKEKICFAPKCWAAVYQIKRRHIPAHHMTDISHGCHNVNQRHLLYSGHIIFRRTRVWTSSWVWYDDPCL
jgi:hypothetical protein